jgi:superfamily II RNA helicase
MRFKKPKFQLGDVWIILDEFIQVRTEPNQTEPEPAAIIPPGSFTAPPIVLDDPKNAAFVQSEIERAECLKIEYQAIADTIDAELIEVDQTINDHTSSEKQIEKARKRKLTLLKQRATNTRALQTIESKIDKLKSNI